MRSPLSPAPLLCALLFICACAPHAALAQQAANAPSLRVTVADAQQRPVSGALCSLTHEGDARQPSTTATTDEHGVATFSSVTPGAYTLRVEREGFEAFSKSVVVKEGPAGELAVSLSVASVAESVTVTGQTESSTSVEAGASIASGNIQRQAIQRLPLAAARVD